MRLPKPCFLTGLAVVAICLAFSSRAEAYYLKKITVAPAKNESGWARAFDPSALITEILVRKIEKSRLLIVSPASGKPTTEMGAAIGGDKKFAKGSSQLILQTRILRFEPGERPPPRPRLSFEETTGPAKEEKLTALAEIEFEIVNGFTGRTFGKESYTFRSVNGDLAIGETPSSLDPFHGDFYRTAMGQVLDHITSHALEQVFTFANERFLEGQVVFLQQEEDEQQVFVNLGQHNGVEVGDTFQVFQVSSEYRDPLNQEDLGHRYKKVGAIRIAEVQPGFAIGLMRAGENFKQGYIVRASKLAPLPDWKKQNKIKAVTHAEMDQLKAAEKEKAPFTSPVLEVPRFQNRMAHFNLFDLVQWTFSY
ncbi:FlgT C-terminal domain-containing protein [Nitrospina gracilis]|uniref:FlgT C-terminal domain-containing protein n=1 Tax=Nitrospina gracilis TaxID=35801 RepID=UPI001F39264E|nr:FlgT C-terminal domain-containing protein [Nitrospina gracilis]MCF8720618.1 hypothetical protein [Nitrospina gracilis Nb-211]